MSASQCSQSRVTVPSLKCAQNDAEQAEPPGTKDGRLPSINPVVNPPPPGAVEFVLERLVAGCLDRDRARDEGMQSRTETAGEGAPVVKDGRAGKVRVSSDSRN